MRLTPDMKVVCVCEKGQVRSVATRYALHSLLHQAGDDGRGKILTAGLTKNDDETLTMLFNWADAIVVCGEPWLLDHPMCRAFVAKCVYLDFGRDVWGNPFGLGAVEKAMGLLRDHV